jgi:hypothetical protein
MSSDRPRLVEFKPVPPGPLADLKDALRRLYLSARPATLDDIHDAIERLDDAAAENPAVTVDAIPARDAIRGILGDATFPANLQNVIAVAAGLLHRHRTRDALVHATVRGNPDVEHIRRLWELAALQRPLGRLISEITPRNLMVSRALGDTHLPPYVKRPHDEELRKLVDAAEAGTSGIAILVSDSTSGKTRACYEALRGLGPDWRVWPTSEGPAAILADLSRVGPRTVVWLDEAQEYLIVPPQADAIANGLLGLLTDRDRAPVLILGTLWPESRDALVRRFPSNRLVEGCFIPVPVVFDEQARQAALETGDPHLVEAVQSAQDGAVVQYLAGVPDLMDRVENASAPARALFEAVGDARRFGHAEEIPEVLLIAAAPGYLDGRERRRLDRDPHWTVTTFESLSWLGSGDMSPLHPSDDGTTHRLEDYLDQHLRRTRRTVPPPAAFWEACVAHTPPPHLNRLGRFASERFLYDYAISLHRRAADVGDTDSLAEWAAILRVRDDLDGLTKLTKERPEPRVFLQLARLYARRHDVDKAKAAFRCAEDAGHHLPDGMVMAEIGRLDPEWAAQRWRGWAANDTVSPLKLVYELDALGLVDEAIDACRACLNEDDDNAAYVLLTLYGKHRDDEAIFRALGELPALKQMRHHPVVQRLLGIQPMSKWPPDDIRQVAYRLHEAGDLDALCRHAAEHPDKVVRRHLTELLLERGHEDEARALAERSKGANRAYTAWLVQQARWRDLGRLIAEGNQRASDALRAHLNGDHDLNSTAQRIKRYGLTPDGDLAW